MKHILYFIIIIPGLMFSQKIDNTVSFREMQRDRYFRFNYENDYFGGVDKNYSQGYSFELVFPVFKKNPLNYIFIIPKKNNNKYGLTLGAIGYTPDHYELPKIQIGDRPFATAILLKSFVVSTDSVRNSRLSSSLSLGLIGPGAFGGETQIAIHEATGNTIPLGWNNQIKNDLVLNYRLAYEKQLLKYRQLFALQGLANAQLGTLFTNATVGFNSTIGIINAPYSRAKKGFSFYFYLQPTVSFVAYDASLQGGVFNKKSPYTIPNGDIERFTAQFDYGLILQTRTIYIEFSRSLITREISTLNSAAWGGVKFGFTF